MAISLETLALARKAAAGAESKLAGSIASINEALKKKGDALEYDGVTLSLKSGAETLASVAVQGGEGGGYPMAEDTEIEDVLNTVFGE